ncbi:hypothetical protein ON010_g6616 [Phytophthora cinnamomi]|nr:hypothetical protein ON010_g6616 [Phytophthora cinnamomi]
MCRSARLNMGELVPTRPAAYARNLPANRFSTATATKSQNLADHYDQFSAVATLLLTDTVATARQAWRLPTREHAKYPPAELEPLMRASLNRLD